MKLVVAIVTKERLEAVQAAFADPAVTLVDVGEVQDLRSPERAAVYRGVAVSFPRTRVRLELVILNEARVGPLVEAARRAAAVPGAGVRGSAEILVMPLAQWETAGVFPEAVDAGRAA